MAVNKMNEIYKCAICGNIVEVVHVGGGALVCCGQEMDLQQENTTDGAVEKHVPAVERDGDIVKVKVGEVPHPMEEKHYIEWIEILADGRSCKKFLKPSEAPEAQFNISSDVESIIVREYCNIHGLWKSGS